MARGRGDAVALNAVDRVYLNRACELAARGLGNTSPNPAVGAVIVKDGRILGEGFHHRRGEPHAEVMALRDVSDARGATAYVSLEPCDHQGLTPPCTRALIEAGVARVVAGAHDPNPRTDGAGIARLREHGIEAEVASEPAALKLIEGFAASVTAARPFVTLKMAGSLDGYVGPSPGSHWLTGNEARSFVRELRASHDAVLVGAGTVRIDDPLLTVRPPRARLRPYVRVVACETEPLPLSSRVFGDPDDGADYAKTIVLAPGGATRAFAPLEAVADVCYVGSAPELDLDGGLRALLDRGITSVLCEGGPTLAARLLSLGLVDRLWWIVAPRFLAGKDAVPALARIGLLEMGRWRFAQTAMLGGDLLIEVGPP